MVTRKIAAHRVILPDGTVYPLSVVELDEAGEVISHHPLVGEEPGVEFYPGEYRIPTKC